MKILFYRYGSICEPDIIKGFEDLGHTVTQITEEITNKTSQIIPKNISVSYYKDNTNYKSLFAQVAFM